MTPKIRKFVLTLHILFTVGWMGAIAAFLALAVAGLGSSEGKLAGSASLAMKLIGWRVIVPLGLASLLSGIVQSLGTSWGLFRHYWVLVKFVLTLVATGLLVLHMSLVNRLADPAGTISSALLRAQRIDIAADAAAAVLLLMVTTALSVYKPRGLTPYGIRKQSRQDREASRVTGSVELEGVVRAPRWVKVFGITALIALVLFRVVLLHVSGTLGHHSH